MIKSIPMVPGIVLVLFAASGCLNARENAAIESTVAIPASDFPGVVAVFKLAPRWKAAGGVISSDSTTINISLTGRARSKGQLKESLSKHRKYGALEEIKVLEFGEFFGYSHIELIEGNADRTAVHYKLSDGVHVIEAMATSKQAMTIADFIDIEKFMRTVSIKGGRGQ